jgi:hypothetical protein
VLWCGIAIYMKKYLKGKRRRIMENSLKYFTMQKYNLPNNTLKETKMLQYIIITLQLISIFNNTSQNIIFQKSSYKNRPIIITQGPKSYDIDIHQLNLGKLKNLKFLGKIPFKICLFLHYFSNEFTIISFFLGKNHYHIKKKIS